MLGWVVGILKNANNNSIYSYLIMGLRKERKWEMSTNWTNFFSFDHNPFNNLLPNKIPAYLHIKPFIEHKLI
jgi:hypothetical protein